MSETVSYQVEAEYQVELPDDFSKESTSTVLEFPRLDGELFPLVAANADVIVSCPWMGGDEVSLTIAMINYPAIMSEENVDQVIADVNMLLASRVLEDEEQELEEQPAEDKDIEKKEDGEDMEEPAVKDKIELKVQLKAESREKDAKVKMVPAAMQPVVAAAENSRLTEKSAETAVKTPHSEGRQLASSKETTLDEGQKQLRLTGDAKYRAATITQEIALEQSADNDSSLSQLEVELVDASDNEALHVATHSESASAKHAENTTVSEAAPEVVQDFGHIETAADGLTQDSYVADADPDLVAIPPKPAISISYAETDLEAATEEVSVSAELGQIEAIVGGKDEDQFEGDSLQQGLIENTEIPYSHGEFDANAETAQLEGIFNNLGLIESQPTEEFLLPRHETFTDDTHDLIEGSLVQLREVQDVDTKDIETSFLYDETTITDISGTEVAQGKAAYTPLTGLEKFADAVPALDHVEAALMRLTDGIDVAEPNTTSNIDKALSEIIGISEKIEVGGNESVAADTQKEIEKLLIKLLDDLGIERSHELVKSLVYMAISSQLEGNLEITIEEDETNSIRGDKARQKILKKLVSVFSYIRKAILNASAIGKSAITLYSYKVAV